MTKKLLMTSRPRLGSS